MIEFITNKPDLAMTLDGSVKVTFIAPKAKLQILSELPKKDFDVTIKQHREKRSLEANSYCWLLITKIADELRTDKEQTYIDMLYKYGQSQVVSVRSDIDIVGYFKYFSVVGYGVVNSVNFTHYAIYKGSSEFDTKEMSIFIDGVVSEAQALGIDTRTPDEIAEMKSLWGKQ